MPKLIDLTGQRFERLKVLCRAENKGKRVCWTCECKCGKIVVVTGHELKAGDTKSCGCLRKETTSALNLTHGNSETRLYRIWAGMKTRIMNENSKDYSVYDARGIAICDEWENDFQAFEQWALSNGYTENLTIDRTNNDKGYSPDNCRWIKNNEQSANRRSNHYITHNSQTRTLSQWAKILNINRAALSRRINKLGWSIEKALTTPPKK